jgi:MFS transporter, SP family, arabinose:H+ symporter
MTSFHKLHTYLGVVAAAALMAGFQYGYTLAIIAGAEPFLTDRFQLTARQLGMVVSNLDLGAALGALLAGPLSDRWGRRKLLLATALLFVMSALMAASANGVPMLLLARAFGGIAVGAAMIMPLYVAEIAPANTRGLLVTLVQIGIVTGILAAFCMGWGTANVGPANWRWMFGLGSLPAMVLLLVTLILPESPRWLVASGQTQAALQVLQPVMGEDLARAALQEIKAAVATESSHWRELFRSELRWALVVGLGLTVLSVTVGINAIILYGPAILMQGAGEDVRAALLGAVALGCVNFVFSLVAMVTIDRIGRRPLLLCGLAGMGIAMLVLGFRFGSADAGTSKTLLVPILSFIAFYAMSLGPITWVLVSEIFPTKTRGVGMAICMIIMYIADFAVTFAFPSMMERLGSGGFHVFALICGIGIVFVAALVPETKGKSLEEIESMWDGRCGR